MPAENNPPMDRADVYASLPSSLPSLPERPTSIPNDGPSSLSARTRPAAARASTANSPAF